MRCGSSFLAVGLSAGEAKARHDDRRRKLSVFVFRFEDNIYVSMEEAEALPCLVASSTWSRGEACMHADEVHRSRSEVGNPPPKSVRHFRYYSTKV